MSNRLKETIIKCSILVTGLLLASSAIIFPVISCYLGYDVEQVENIWIALWILTLISGAIMLALISFLRIIKTAQPDKIPLQHTTYESFSAYVNELLYMKGYLKQVNLPILPYGEVTVYIKSPKMQVLDCFAIIRTSELSQSILQDANEKITKIMITQGWQKNILLTVNMISVFCVDRITSVFRKVFSEPTHQGARVGRLLVGISFGGKHIYIAKQNDGFAMRRYKKLYNTFMDIIVEQEDGSGAGGGDKGTTKTGDGSLS